MTKIAIRWLAVPNRNRLLAGWLPQVEVNGRPTLSDWSTASMDARAALDGAKERAEAEAQKYVGDYEVTIAAATPGGQS